MFVFCYISWQLLDELKWHLVELSKVSWGWILMTLVSTLLFIAHHHQVKFCIRPVYLYIHKDILVHLKKLNWSETQVTRWFMIKVRHQVKHCPSSLSEFIRRAFDVNTKSTSPLLVLCRLLNETAWSGMLWWRQVWTVSDFPLLGQPDAQHICFIFLWPDISQEQPESKLD